LRQAKHHAFVIHNVTAEEAGAAFTHQLAHRYAKGDMAGIDQQSGRRCGKGIAPAGDDADKHKFRGARQY